MYCCFSKCECSWFHDEKVHPGRPSNRSDLNIIAHNLRCPERKEKNKRELPNAPGFNNNVFTKFLQLAQNAAPGQVKVVRRLTLLAATSREL